MACHCLGGKRLSYPVSSLTVHDPADCSAHHWYRAILRCQFNSNPMGTDQTTRLRISPSSKYVSAGRTSSFACHHPRASQARRNTSCMLLTLERASVEISVRGQDASVFSPTRPALLHRARPRHRSYVDASPAPFAAAPSPSAQPPGPMPRPRAHRTLR